MATHEISMTQPCSGALIRKSEGIKPGLGILTNLGNLGTNSIMCGVKLTVST